MSNLLAYAKTELAMLRGPDADAMQDMIERDILDLVARFGGQGHSGSSAAYTIKVLEKLLRFEPLTPLTGADGEWHEVGEQNGGPLLQNKRCSHVFKDPTGAYDIDGKIFVEPDGSAFTSRDSRVAVAFPYVPKREYVQIEAGK